MVGLIYTVGSVDSRINRYSRIRCLQLMLKIKTVLTRNNIMKYWNSSEQDPKVFC